MNLKISIFVIIFLLLVSSFISSANVKEDISCIYTSEKLNIIEIKVAVLSQENTYASMVDFFTNIIDGYHWTVRNKSYNFITILISEMDVLKGKLTTENFDLLHIPAMEADRLTLKRFYPSIQNKIWKTNIANFIKNGGGYVGYCAGASIVMGTDDKSKTLSQIILDNMVEISSVKRFREDNLPFFYQVPFLCQLSGKPEAIGDDAYRWFGSDENNESHWFGGCPIDFNVNRANPIFDDLIEEKRRIYWASGGTYVVPNNAESNVTVLAYYPSGEISENESTQIHAWKYTGRIRGFFKGFLKSIKERRNIMEALSFTSVKAYDWEPTDTIIQTNHSSKPFMTMETYPNDNQARIILCAGHPEMFVWWGGHIKKVEDTDDNNLFDGLYRWVDITSFDETPQDEKTYNWWIIRRHVAWASKKVPDNDLPPVYGPSQVCDFESNVSTLDFSVVGNSEKSDGIMSLDLYYRFSDDNLLWGNWTLYDTDTDDSDGWSWEFHALNDTGFYQFYSIRNVEYERVIETEKVPPGPDAVVIVEAE